MFDDGKKLRNVLRHIFFSLSMFALAFFILYACAQTQQTQKESQPVQKTATPAPPLPQQAPPMMDFLTYSGNLSEPDGFPEPGPPYTRQNSDPHQVLKELPTDELNLTDWVKSGGMSRPSGEALYSMDKESAVIKPHDFLDLRNVYDHKRMAELGFQYVCLGRGVPKA